MDFSLLHDVANTASNITPATDAAARLILKYFILHCFFLLVEKADIITNSSVRLDKI